MSGLEALNSAAHRVKPSSMVAKVDLVHDRAREDGRDQQLSVVDVESQADERVRRVGRRFCDQLEASCADRRAHRR
ncbi:hypothetical protein ACIRSU_12785 [Streptomyces sp. NPDC101160]|uniref:hypothetical protein n=1 Tax=Streptomyces sp. NPDC101160 TaxID=3366118 RepID=UPI00381E9186